jgi:hypothetical protein
MIMATVLFKYLGEVILFSLPELRLGHGLLFRTFATERGVGET